MQLHALVEVWPSETMVYIAELPGCVAAGRSSDLALERLPDAVEEHLGWLAGYGFSLVAELVEVEIAEQLTAQAGLGPLFAADRAAVTADDLEQALRISALARRDLIDVYRSVSALRRARRPAADAWSIAEHLLHVARLDLHYLAAFMGGGGAVQAADLPADPVAALQASGAITSEALTALTQAGRDALVTTAGDELWTLGKVVRRMVGHQREHYPWVLAIARG